MLPTPSCLSRSFPTPAAPNSKSHSTASASDDPFTPPDDVIFDDKPAKTASTSSGSSSRSTSSYSAQIAFDLVLATSKFEEVRMMLNVESHSAARAYLEASFESKLIDDEYIENLTPWDIQIFSAILTSKDAEIQQLIEEHNILCLSPASLAVLAFSDEIGSLLKSGAITFTDIEIIDGLIDAKKIKSHPLDDRLTLHRLAIGRLTVDNIIRDLTPPVSTPRQLVRSSLPSSSKPPLTASPEKTPARNTDSGAPYTSSNHGLHGYKRAKASTASPGVSSTPLTFESILSAPKFGKVGMILNTITHPGVRIYLETSFKRGLIDAEYIKNLAPWDLVLFSTILESEDPNLRRLLKENGEHAILSLGSAFLAALAFHKEMGLLLKKGVITLVHIKTMDELMNKGKIDSHPLDNESLLRELMTGRVTMDEITRNLIHDIDMSDIGDA